MWYGNGGTDEIRKEMDAIRAVEKRIQDARLELSLTEVMLDMAKEHDHEVSLAYVELLQRERQLKRCVAANAGYGKGSNKN